MLKIKKAEVVKNSRILLGEDCNIRYHPQTPYQVIIGQNGIGKTTFLSALIAYPQQGNKSYHKHGHSTIEFETEDSTVITSIGADGKYSFVLDGQELNTGGTQSVQKDMFTEHLGITADIEAILNPNFDFLAMTPQKRQDFLAKLTTGDLSFALQLYKKLEQRARSHESTVKRLEFNLTDLKMKVIPEDEYKGHKERLETLNKDIRDLLIEIKETSGEHSTTSVDTYMRRYDDFYQRASKDWVKNYCFGGIDATSPEGARTIITRIESEITANKDKVESLTQQHQMFHEVLENLSNTSDGESIDGKIKVLEDELALYPSDKNLLQFDLGREEIHYSQAYNMLESVYKEVSQLISQLGPEWNEDNLLANIDTLATTYRNTEQQLYKLEQEVTSIDSELEHTHQGEVRCPDCGKQFTPGRDEARKSVLIKRREVIVGSIQRGQAVLEKQAAFGSDVRLCQKRYNEIRSLCRQPLLAPIFESIDNVASLINTPDVWLQKLTFAIQSIEIKSIKLRLTNDIRILEEQRLMLARNNIQSSQGLEERLVDIDQDIWKVNNYIYTLTDRANEFKERLKRIEHYDRWAEAIESEYVDLIHGVTDAAEYELNVIRKELLETLQSSASDLSNFINNYDQVVSQINYLENLIEQERNLGKACRLSADELSPKTGLIAEQMYGFIGAFLDDVMEICNAIWTYNVEIFPGKDNQSALSYIFPVEFNDSGNYSDDIAKTSEGQYSLINFAIKITALRYAGYTEGPLFLDEPDGKIHPTHKIKMMNFIRDMIENGLFTQVFMISHHESGWGALPKPDIIDFSYTQALPGTNEVIQFT